MDEMDPLLAENNLTCLEELHPLNTIFEILKNLGIPYNFYFESSYRDGCGQFNDQLSVTLKELVQISLNK